MGAPHPDWRLGRPPRGRARLTDLKGAWAQAPDCYYGYEQCPFTFSTSRRSHRDSPEKQAGQPLTALKTNQPNKQNNRLQAGQYWSQGPGEEQVSEGLPADTCSPKAPGGDGGGSGATSHSCGAHEQASAVHAETETHTCVHSSFAPKSPKGRQSRCPPTDGWTLRVMAPPPQAPVLVCTRLTAFHGLHCQVLVEVPAFLLQEIGFRVSATLL